MQPVSAPMPVAPRMVNDVSRPAPARPTAVPTAPATNLVANIPVHNPADQTTPLGEDDELDKIMQDVGREMNKEENKSRKHRFLHFGHKTKTVPKPAVPVSATVQSAPAPMPQPQPVAQPQAAAAVPPLQPQALQAAATKPKEQSSAPVFAIFVAILVTGFLIAAAIAAYRQS